MITFTTSDRADALYYYNGLSSGRVVSGSYTADGQVRTFAGIIVSWSRPTSRTFGMSQFDYLILGRVRKEETAARSIRTHPGMAPSGNASLSGPNTAGSFTAAFGHWYARRPRTGFRRRLNSLAAGITCSCAKVLGTLGGV